MAKVRGKGVVFLAWGNPAAKRVTKVNRGKHLVLQSVHPSPLSASRGFFQCGHFKKTNDWLAERYGVDGTIDWNLDKPKPIAAPAAHTPVKATEAQEEAQEDGPVTEKSEKREDFDDEDDQDAIEALEAIANSTANGAEPAQSSATLAGDLKGGDAKEAVAEAEQFTEEAKKEDKPVADVLS